MPPLHSSLRGVHLLQHRGKASRRGGHGKASRRGGHTNTTRNPNARRSLFRPRTGPEARGQKSRDVVPDSEACVISDSEACVLPAGGDVL